MRATLNKLAIIAPEWLQKIVPESWYTEYGNKFEQYRLPKEKKEQLELAKKIGKDGNYLLDSINDYTGKEKPDLIAATEILQQIWSQQYCFLENELQWRDDKELPPNQLRIESPYDIEARNRTKRTTNWTGYAVKEQKLVMRIALI